MDSVTHIAIGACIGQGFAGKTVGRKALIWGILAQSLPDIDFVSSFWMDTPTHLLAHRGFTHSILFNLLASFIMAGIAEKVHRPHNISYKKWLLFFLAATMGHLFLDAFNNYGVGWFEPFSHYRISFNTLYVADPLFTIGSVIALVALIILKKDNPKRNFWWKFGLMAPMIYLGISILNKFVADHDVNKAFAKQSIPHQRYFTTPAPLQNLLWFVVAGNDSGYYVGYHSLLEKSDSITFTFFPRKDSLLAPYRKTASVEKLIRFSQQFYTAEYYGDTLVLNDLRFGQTIGWYNPKEKFAFHYYLQYPDDNNLVVQRGRFAGWNEETLKALLRRIAGN